MHSTSGAKGEATSAAPRAAFDVREEAIVKTSTAAQYSARCYNDFLKPTPLPGRIRTAPWSRLDSISVQALLAAFHDLIVRSATVVAGGYSLAHEIA